MTVHGARIEGWGPVIFGLDKLYYPFAKHVLKSMQAVIALTRAERNHLLRRFKLHPEKVVVIPNGIEIDRFASDKSAVKKFIEKHRLRGDSFKVLYVGRFVSQKNPEKLISAVTKHMKNQNVEAILIGEGPQSYVNKLKKMSDERVRVLTKVKFEEIVAAYHACDLFTILSPSEGLPTTLLEAMVCGLPILTTPVGGIPDVITKGVNGLFLDLPVREEDVARKISHFMDMNASGVNRIGKTNVKKIKTRYNWEIVADEILSAYNQVLGM
jgi:glycosyltransferase involved in cell wall biosynthesis